MMKKRGLIRQLLIFLISFIVFFVTTYPLRNVFTVFTVTDVRPGVVFNPFLSICLGPAAAFGCACSNMLQDYLAGYPLFVVLLGCPLQFLYGFVAWLLWKLLTRNCEHRYRMGSISKLLKFTLVALAFAGVSCFGVGMFVHLIYNAHFWDTAKYVFLNNFDFVMVLGLPLMILANLVVGRRNDKSRTPSTIESIILFAIVICLIGMGVLIYAVYKTYTVGAPEVFDLWNEIYFFCAIYINLVLVALIGAVAIIERRIRKHREDVISLE